MIGMGFPALKNDLVLRAARGEPVERVPVWCHRQAGRYLSEFRELRTKHAFFDICRSPDLACEVTLQPFDHINYDASIIFSDILVIPQALGLEVEMLPGVGPSFPSPLTEPSDIKRLNSKVDIQKELQYVFDAITLTRVRLEGRVPLLGFSGAPWTLMAYCVEGKGSKTLSKAKKWLFAHPEESKALLQILTDAIVPYLVGQVKAGAQMLEVFDTSAGMLAPAEFLEFCLPYLQQIAERVKQDLSSCGVEPVPMILFAKGANYALKEMSETPFDVLSIDWTISPAAARAAVGDRVTLQGNIDPCAIYSSDESLRKRVRQMIDEFGCSRYIVNLGHGVYPDFEVRKLKCFVDEVQSYSRASLQQARD